MVDIRYIAPMGRQATEVADAIGVHLSYLAAGYEDIRLQQISKVIVENADQTIMPPSVFNQFDELLRQSERLAGEVRARFIRHRITFNLTTQAYRALGEKVNVLRGFSDNIKENDIVVEISAILGEYIFYKGKTEEKYSADGWLEVISKRVLEQVVSPQFNDLALSQASIKASMVTKADLTTTKADLKTEIDELPEKLVQAIMKRFPNLGGGTL